MKTPREILLRKHRTTESKLNDLRHALVKDLNNKETKQPKPGFVSLFFRCSQLLWNELIWPARRIWAGLAASWLFILVANVSFQTHAPHIAAATPTHSPDYLRALHEQQQLVAELTGRPRPKAVEATKPVAPQPRSDLRLELLNAQNV